MKTPPPSETKAPSARPGGWRRWVAWFILVLFAGEITAALFIKRADKTFAVSQFAKLPLTFNGRVQPMDSLARNSLLQIRGITEVPLEGNGAGGAWGKWEELSAKGELAERRWHQFSKHPKKLKPADWLLEVFCNPRQADDRYIFVINHPDLRSLLKLEGGVDKSGLHFYRFNDIKDRLDTLRTEVERVGKLDSSQRNQFDQAVLQLNNAFGLYFRLKNTLQPEDTADFRKEIDDYLAAVAQARATVQERQAKGEKLDEDAITEIVAPVQKLSRRYEAMARMENPLIVPPANHATHGHAWQRMGDALLEAPKEGMPDTVLLLAGMAATYRAGEVEKFNQLLGDYRALLEKEGLTKELTKGAREAFFNQLLAFKRSMYVYLMAFLLVLLYWANLNDLWRVTAVRLVLLGFLVHTAGLIFRMWLEGRPPVTNLYSSAIFIGWGAVVLGMVLEKTFRNGIGIIMSAAVGFVTLIIAHNLSLGGDTMEMMRAVLDTNFWLATHVVVVTLGYASTFAAGFLGIIYVLLGVFTVRLSTVLSEKTATGVGMTVGLVAGGTLGAATGAVIARQSARLGDSFGKTLSRMVYAIVCFATLFSFVGTVLGGIWADQSWGRFWGWDPKENGALIIVLWNALILHLRWGGMIRERGLINCAIVGNIVTSWSWFGVNMLEIGLHSYGFTSASFQWLMLFVASQLLLIGNGLIPQRFWSSAIVPQPKPEWWPRAVAVGVPALAVILWLTAGVKWCLAVAGVYLVVMLCLALVQWLEVRFRVKPPPLPKPDAGGDAKVEPARA